MKIIIQGTAGEGKSTVALMLERFLESQGFTVENVDIDRWDGCTTPLYERHLAAMKAKAPKLVIDTQNVRE